MTEPSLFSRFLGADDSLPPPLVMTSTKTSSTGAPTAPAATGPTTPHVTTSVPAPIKSAPPRSPVSHPEMCVCDWETGGGGLFATRVCGLGLGAGCPRARVPRKEEEGARAIPRGAALSSSQT
jgi:hypothetical protein